MQHNKHNIAQQENMSAQGSIYIYIYICIYMYMYMCIYMYIYICVCILANTCWFTPILRQHMFRSSHVPSITFVDSFVKHICLSKFIRRRSSVEICSPNFVEICSSNLICRNLLVVVRPSQLFVEIRSSKFMRRRSLNATSDT